jgi:FkbM family methyltransferase
MTVRSYAQNFEDVLLWRVLKDVPCGTYVDVGAGHPVRHSVTKLFYDAGWSGINVEPVPALAEALTRARERDTNVHAAVSSNDVDSIELSIVLDWDELSTISVERVEELRAEGRAMATQRVPVVRLDALLQEHAGRDIHFLKIDVEGAELDVLASIDLDRIRPWIVLAEVLAADAGMHSRPAIRSLLEEHRYTHAWFDGLNDYFVAEEHSERLLPRLGTPVNVTDDFVVASDTDDVVLPLIGEKLGLESPVQGSEVIQRVEALLRDRLHFGRMSETLASTLEEREASFEKMAVEAQQETLKLEALEQASFERERMIAWYASELNNHRLRNEELSRRVEEQFQHLRAMEAAHADVEERYAGLLQSTSWRATLPLRAVRRPQLYVRRLVRR